MVKIGKIELGEFPLLLAPMEDVSGPPFRAVCKANGADLVYSEFISSEGLIRNAAKSVKKLDIFDSERPVGIQLFGSSTDSMKEAAIVATKANPDIIDINYGCPVKAVACKGAGAALLQNIPKMVEMTQEVVNNTNLPVTVKTRLGWDESSKNIEEVAERLQDIGIKAICIHGRTRSQLYKGSADWTLIAKVKNNQRIKIPVFGNGDIDSPQKALEYKNRYGVDGIMIGRAAIGNPWIFREIKHFIAYSEFYQPVQLSERVHACKTHLIQNIKWKNGVVGILEMRKHYSNYFKGLPHFKEIKSKLVTSVELEEIIDTLDKIESEYCFIDN